MSDRAMRILQVSASDRMGGAERIAATLCAGYRERGHESWLAVGQKTTDDAGAFEIDNEARRGAWAKMWRAMAGGLNPLARVRGVKRLQLLMRDTIGQPRRTARRNRGEEDFDFPASADFPALTPVPPDLLHLHNLHAPGGGYFDLRELPALSALFPTVFTLHDAWLLSGHCAHSFDCERWRTGCGSCPDLSIYPSIRRDATAFNWERKRELFARSRLHVCTPSRWLMGKVEESMLQPAVVEARVIANGIDLDIYRPGDQAAARRELGLPRDARILLFAANGIRSNPFKDFRTMRAALERVGADDGAEPVLFLALGEDLPEEKLGCATLRFVPFQQNEVAVARYYQAADVYVHAARADTFPTSVLEALACGRPVIGSNVGGIPEQVDEGQTGFFTPVGDAAALAASMRRLLHDADARRAMGERAAEVARERFDARRQVDAHLAWYREILDRAAAATS